MSLTAPDTRPPKRISGEERRLELIQCAIQLFAQKGFRGTTTKEIAQAAGVNEALIFRHFATKEDLYAAILDYKAAQTRTETLLSELMEHARKRDDATVFSEFARKILNHHCSDSCFLHLMLYSALEGHQLARMFRERQVRPVHDFLRAYIVERQREGGFRECNPDAAVRAFIGMVSHHAMAKQLFCDNTVNFSDEEAVSSFTRIFLQGLRAP